MAGTLKTFASLRVREEGQCIAGRYVLRQHLGEGSSAKVYAAEDLSQQREVAIKLLRRSADVQETRKRFCAEKEALQRLAGAPHTVQLYDYGDDRKEEFFLVVERVHGLPLSALLDAFSKTCTQWEVPQVLLWFDQICRAIGAAHSAGVIHRDIKPSNIMLTSSEPREAKVFDFGVAYSPALLHESTKECSGTHGYMSPEQIDGVPDLTAASDVFSLAVLLTEMLEPRLRGMTGETLIGTLAIWKPDGLRRCLGTVRSDVPDSLWDVVARALAHDPARRYQTAEDLRLALHDAVSTGTGTLPPCLAA